jgi:hypothetical protein
MTHNVKTKKYLKSGYYLNRYLQVKTYLKLFEVWVQTTRYQPNLELSIYEDYR